MMLPIRRVSAKANGLSAASARKAHHRLTSVSQWTGTLPDNSSRPRRRGPASSVSPSRRESNRASLRRPRSSVRRSKCNKTRGSILIRMKSVLLAAAMAFASATLFADADLQLIVSQVNPTTVLAGALRSLPLTVHNSGPDAAKDVIVTVTATGGVSTGLCATGCLVGIGTVPVGDLSLSTVVAYPDTPGDVTITASVTSSTPDANTANNRVSLTVHVSPNPA